jgi:tripartite-type tricarboxylate transporter receptor subunit TctC
MKKILFLMSLLFALNASAETLRIVVPYPPGGPADAIARQLQRDLSDYTIIVENKVGASGEIGTAYTANLNEPAIVVNTVGILTSPELPQLKKVTTLGRIPLILVSAKLDRHFKNWTHVNFATSGIGTATHNATQELITKLKLDAELIPYKGVGQSIIDIMTGQVDAGFIYYNQMRNDERLHVIAVEWPRRLDIIPTVPTFRELGINDVGHNNWWAVYSNKFVKTDTLHQDINKIINDPTKFKAYQELGLMNDSAIK